jgi:hypothetical protein
MAAGTEYSSPVRSDLMTILIASAVAFIAKSFKIITAWRGQYRMTFITPERPGDGLADDTKFSEVDFMDQEIAVDHQLFFGLTIVGMAADATIEFQDLRFEIGMMTIITLLPVAPVTDHAIVTVAPAGLLMLAQP